MRDSWIIAPIAPWWGIRQLIVRDSLQKDVAIEDKHGRSHSQIRKNMAMEDNGKTTTEEVINKKVQQQEGPELSNEFELLVVWQG